MIEAANLFANCKLVVILLNRERTKVGHHVTVLPHFRFPTDATSQHEPIPLLTSCFAGAVTGPLNIALSIQTLSMLPKPKTTSNKKRGVPHCMCNLIYVEHPHLSMV